MSERNLTQVGGSFVGAMEDFMYDEPSKQPSRELYIFDQDDHLLTVLSESTGLVSAKFRDQLNSVADEPFVFTVDADVERAKYIREEHQVAFRDKEGDLRLYTIKEIDDLDNIDGPQTTATCEPTFMELKEHIVVDRRFVEKEAQEALDGALDGTRWTGVVEVSLGLATTNFYYISSVDAIWRILEVWGGDFKDVVEFDGNKITKREIRIKQRLGADRGLRFEIDHNIEEIQRTVLSYPVTALYGRGASLEITDEEGEHTGGYTRYIDFADVEWKKSNGDPVDKPKGQKWVGDPEALQRYGRQHDGKLLHRFGIWEDHDIEDPAELLRATWEALKEAQKPEVNYRLSIDLLDKEISLGDTARAIDRKFARPIEIQTRVIAIEYDLLDIEGTIIVEMGQFLNLQDDRLDRVIGDIERNRGRWEYINERSYPNRIPSKPTNVEAHGGFRVIQLYWDYTNEMYVKHYEVYGSQTQGFVPDSQHLLWRGDVSAFSHEVNTDERWYYRVRAVNYHGRGGDFSDEVSASTVRIITDDILFGAIIADHLEDNLDIADKLSERTVERINEGPMEAIEYTQDQIEQTEQVILSELDTRIGDVNTDISDLLDRTEGLEGSVTTINQEVDDIEGRLSTTITELNNLDVVVSEHTTTLQQHADLISAKAEKTEVYTRAETDDLLGEKVDQTVYNNKISEIELDIDGITSRVSNTETEIGGLTGDVNSALSQIAELDIRADGISQSVSEVRNDLESRTTIQDTREDDFPPSYYWENHKRQTVEEFKQRTTMGVSKGETYGVLITIVPWSDSSGGYIKQTFRTGNYIFERTSATDDSWTPWRELEDTEGAQEKVNEAIAPVNSRLTSAETRIEQNAEQIELRATKTEVDSLEDRMSQAESQISVMSDEIDLKVDVDGIVSAINLSEEGVRISGEKIHLSGQTLIEDGIIGTAAIANAAITRAKLGTAVVDTAQIEDAAITSAKIADLAVDTAHIANAAVTNAKIANVNASKITAGIIDASRVTVRSQSGSNIVQLDGDGFRTRDSRGRTRIIINVRDWDGNEADPAFMRFLDPAGNAVGAIGSNVNNHFVIGGTGALQFDMEDNIVMAAQQFRVQTHGISRPNDFFQFSSIENTSGTYREPYFRTPFDADGYIGSASYRWWRVYSVHVHCSELHESSTRDEKTNIKDADIDALQDVFDRLNLKTFYRTINGKVIDPIKGIGVIAEESPQEILDETGKSVILRNFLAVVAGAMKKQQQRIDDLEKQVKEMRA